MKNEDIDQEAGFTLIELLVAFVLLGFLMSLLYGSFTFAGRVTLRTSENNARSFETFQTQAFLTELLNNIYPERNGFRGTQDYMTFVAPLNREGIAQGLYEITLQQEIQGRVVDLTLSWKAMHQDNKGGQYAEGSIILLENIERMEFSYFDSGSNGSQAIWSSAWDQEGDLPSLVRLKLASDAGGEDKWPEQVVKINITHNVDCMYDPVSRGCIYR